MLILLAVHFAVAVSLPLLAPWLGRLVWPLAAAVPAATVGWAAAHTPLVLSGGTVQERLGWAAPLGLEFVHRLDGLSLLMVYVVSGVGTAVLVYSAQYFPRGAGREAGLLLAFAGTMLGLVTADHLLALYVFWELTTVVSFLLISGRGRGPAHRRAAEQALLTTAAGGLAMFFGFLLLGHQAGTYRVSALVADPPRGAVVSLALVLVLLGAFAKSAQLPLSAWLPAAMVAPAPVTAYLHAAAMVKAGVYLVALLTPGFADAVPWRPAVLVVGLVTMVVAGWRALAQTDLKVLLAYGTVSELGMLVALLGTGVRVAALAGAVMLLAHAAFKATLFLVVGVLDHDAGTRDLRRLSGVGRRRPALLAVAGVAAASMAGLPPLLGFLGKEAAYEAFWHEGFTGHLAALAGLFLGSVLTVAYAARFLWGAFADKPRVGATDIPPTGPVLLVPAALLATAGLALGVWYPATAALVQPYAADQALSPGAGGEYELKLWHGLTPVLLLSLVTLGLGVLLHQARGTLVAVRRRQARLPRPPSAQRGYEQAVRATDLLAVWVTRHTQVGSLPVYLTVLLATVVLVPGTALLTADVHLPRLEVWLSPLQLPLAVLVLTAAVAVTTARQRLTAVLLTGAAGYGVAGLFLLHGAPDLALAQFLVESLTLVVTVLVLRQLPGRFTPPPHAPTLGDRLKALVAGAMGVLVAVLALVAREARGGQSPVAADYLRLSPKEAGAKNAVNGVIVDFRALDTVGEISVLTVTVAGVVALIGFLPPEPLPSARATVQRDRQAPPHRAAQWDVPRQPWLPEAAALPRHERSVLLEVVTRLLFPSVLVLSVYLLFAGHSRPGGGFTGGLVAGQAFVLRHLVGGQAGRTFAVPVDPRTVAGGGLAVAALAALVPPTLGDAPLSSAVLSPRVPLLGTVTFSTSVFFDIGVYLLVVGFCLMLLHAVEQARTPLRDTGAPGRW